MRRHLVLGLIACIGLTAYTSHKLYKMRRITGEQASESRRVIDKLVKHHRRADSCYFLAPDEIQADCDYFERVEIGDTIEVVTVDGEQYVKGGDVYTSEGNFIFDIVLLVAEVVGVIVCIVLLVFRRPRSRRASPS